MLVPKIIYNDGTGDVTLNFSFPPINKPGPHDGTSDQRDPQRVDSVTLSGKVQSAYWRTDIWRELNMEYIPQEDLPAWNDFIKYAEKGGQFEYYQDATDDNTHQTCMLKLDPYAPARNIFRVAKVKLTLRLIQ